MRGIPQMWLDLRIPRRASVLFMRLMMRVRSLIRLSRSRLGRPASSSSILGIATIPQAQPAQKYAHQHRRIQTIRFSPLALA
jgi:hypothetical protein